MIILRKTFSAADYVLGGGIGALSGVYGGMIAAGKKSRKAKKEAEKESQEIDLDKEVERINKIRKTGDPKLKKPWDLYDPEEFDYDSDYERKETIQKLKEKDPEFEKKYRKKIAKGIFKEKEIDSELFNKTIKGAGIGALAGLATTGGIKLAKKLKK